MMAGFTSVRIADIAEVKGGKRLPANANLVTTPTSHPYIRGRDIRDGKITFDDAMYVLDEDFEKIRRYTVDSGDVCITIVGNIGDVGITPPHLDGASLTENAVKLVNLREDFDARFLMYALLTPDAQSQMKLSAAGAAQPKLGIYKVNEIKIPALPSSLQNRIAGILSAYDELMENCQRRIRILEEMARALYREWFVHFRFPGHEKVPRVDSALGPIPKGWEVKKLGDVADISWGDTSTTKASYVQEGYAAYSASGSDGKLDHFDFDQTGIVLSAIGAQCGKTWLARGKWSCIKNTIRFWSKNECASTEFLFIVTEGQDFWPRRGAAQPFISQGDAERIDLLIPDRATMNRFTTFAAASLERIATLEVQIENLRRTRDLLLPRLLSGQVPLDVSEDVAESTTSAPPPAETVSASVEPVLRAGTVPAHRGGVR